MSNSLTEEDHTRDNRQKDLQEQNADGGLPASVLELLYVIVCHRNGVSMGREGHNVRSDGPCSASLPIGRLSYVF